MPDRPLGELELTGELLGRPRPLSEERDDAPAELVAERLELLGVGDDERVVRRVVGGIPMVDGSNIYDITRLFGRTSVSDTDLCQEQIASKECESLHSRCPGAERNPFAVAAFSGQVRRRRVDLRCLTP
jgi:hypothetical protein